MSTIPDPLGGDAAAPAPAAPAPDTPAPAVRLGAEGLKPVSPRLIPARRLAAAIPCAILLAAAVGCVVVGVLADLWWMHLIALLPLVIAAQWILLTGRRVRAIGYLDREDDLVVAKGLMLRSVTVTPYGRVQSVEVSEGPIQRRFGLASLSLSTAATAADADIPGLPREEAERLRALLAARGIDRMQSL
ncbi:PH domain-containing protein [Brachybacterium nesterenkovii]|uniref:Transmembrane protein, distant homology with ydbS n=1 Tax=Brachybacterium nesterenkovii TaxID=47847 RepID=A0A1X6X0W3_9MICO|nr:PH domain-containing protein [Brachybacterium nesterenkovii]SLM92031.1 transmembrane protein, distant homology with ydbS [Brachybacterium nesterenkovii]